jgi:hypothetical protein
MSTYEKQIVFVEECRRTTMALRVLFGWFLEGGVVQIAVAVAIAKGNDPIDKAVKEATSEAVGSG